MKKFVHALNAMDAYIGMETFGNVQTVTTQKKIKLRHEKQCSPSLENIQWQGAFVRLCSYASISMLTPDFNSTVMRSSQTVICLIQRFTSVSSKPVRCVGC